MSKQKVKDALLKGFNPPMFPVTLDALRMVQEATCTTTGHALELVAKRIGGFIRRDRPKTSDGYDWFWALHFRCGRVHIAILFPWWQDFLSTDGDMSDRSIAIYTKGEEDETEIDQLIVQLQEQMHAVHEERVVTVGTE